MLGANGDVASLNLFAYCGNNPVSRKDIGGYFWDIVFDVGSLALSIFEVMANPTDVGAWIGLAFDVVDVAVPFVGGLGEVARAVDATLEVADAVRTADNLGDAGELVIKYGDEVKLPNQIKTTEAVDAWDDFLGPNQTSYNKFTGKNEMDRIFSEDGTKSIRFGNHETKSLSTTKAHFHYETWTYNRATNSVFVENVLQRMK